MKILKKLFGEKTTSKQSAEIALETMSVQELVSQLASLTSSQVAGFVVFGQEPPKLIKKLCDLGPKAVQFLNEELENRLAEPQPAGGAVASIISSTYILCAISTPECLVGILRVMDYSAFVMSFVNTGAGMGMVDPFESLYNLCAETIGKIGDKSVVPELIRIIQDPEKISVRPSACKAVGLLRAQEARKALTAALKDYNPDTGSVVREYAAQALKLLDEAP